MDATTLVTLTSEDASESLLTATVLGNESGAVSVQLVQKATRTPITVTSITVAGRAGQEGDQPRDAVSEGGP